MNNLFFKCLFTRQIPILFRMGRILGKGRCYGPACDLPTARRERSFSSQFSVPRAAVRGGRPFCCQVIMSRELI